MVQWGLQPINIFQSLSSAGLEMGIQVAALCLLVFVCQILYCGAAGMSPKGWWKRAAEQERRDADESRARNEGPAYIRGQKRFKRSLVEKWVMSSSSSAQIKRDVQIAEARWPTTRDVPPPNHICNPPTLYFPCRPTPPHRNRATLQPNSTCSLLPPLPRLMAQKEQVPSQSHRR